MVHRADKGHASIVLDSTTYHDKITTLSESSPYRLLNKVPTDCLSRRLTEKLLTLIRSGHLSESIDNKNRPRQKQPSRIYSLPKNDRVNTPLRPIVSCVNTFAYDLANILPPLTGKPDYTVNNSAHNTFFRPRALSS